MSPEVDAAYVLPAAQPGRILFSTRSIDPEVAVTEAQRNGLWASPALRDRLWPLDVQSARPLMPLRKGHLAMLIAAGFLNSLCLEESGGRVLVKGRTYKEFVLSETTEESETYREVLRTSVVALDLESGAFMDIRARFPPDRSPAERDRQSKPRGAFEASLILSHQLQREVRLMDLIQFIERYREAITSKVINTYPPLYRPSPNGPELPTSRRHPLGAQGDAIRAAALSLKTQRGTTVVGEMGTGKTFIAAAAVYLADSQRVLVLCPPHLVRKWRREVKDTVPHTEAAIVRSITDLERLRHSTVRPLFCILSRERAKLSYRCKPALVYRWAVSGGRLLRDGESGEPFKVPCCPACFVQALDEDGVPLTAAQLARKKQRCSACSQALWQADRSGPRRIPLADYVKRRMRGFFDLLVGDEVHEYKARGSA